MSNSVIEDQDPRNNAGLEDLTTMTIESLRARLLSERAISRTARQRADELSKRVAELEEQLKIVSLRRKKAEKATADVLAILESNGISDASEAFDSSSNQETSICDSKVGNDTAGRNESSTNFDLRRNDIEAYSSSEIDSSRSTGRSLSWKSSKESPPCLERNKFKDSVRRRSSSFVSNDSLPKRTGKSCRRIRRRETRSAPVDMANDDSRDDVHNTMLTTLPQNLPNSEFGCDAKKKDSEDHEEKDLTGASLAEISGNGISEAKSSSREGWVGDKDRDLQSKPHAVKYKAEEKAKRECEEKLREDNNCLLDSGDPGNRSDVTEERDDIRLTSTGMENWQGPEREQETGKNYSGEKPEDLSKFMGPPHIDNRKTEDQRTGFGRESSSSEFAFPVSRGTHEQVLSENFEGRPSHGSFTCFLSNSSVGNPNGQSSGSKKELSLTPQSSPSKLESVLDALQQAKLSLKHKLHSMPQLEVGSSAKGIESSIPTGHTRDRMDFPLGCPPGIFRLPTDFQFERSANANYLCSDSVLRPQSYYLGSAHDRLISRMPFMGSTLTSSTSDLLYTSSSMASMEMSSGIDTYTTPHFTERLGVHASSAPFNSSTASMVMSSGNHSYTTPHFSERLGGHASAAAISNIRPILPATQTAFRAAPDTGPASSARPTLIDSQMNAGFPFSSNYAYPTYPFSPDVTPQLYSGERFQNHTRGMNFGASSVPRFPLYDDHIRPTMYK